MAKYDWPKLKTEYITGSFESLKDFADAKSINYSVLRQRSKGWNDEKLTKDIQKANKITDKTIAKQIESESEINTKHYELWVQILTKATTLAKDAESGGQLKTLAEVIEKAQKGQRLARGMDKEAFKPVDDPRPINIIFKDTKGKE